MDLYPEYAYLPWAFIGLSENSIWKFDKETKDYVQTTFTLSNIKTMSTYFTDFFTAHTANDDLIAYNLFEDHVALPMKNYPKIGSSLYVDFPLGLP